jgi:hypothetical protein
MEPRFSRISAAGPENDYSALESWNAATQSQSGALQIAVLDPSFAEQFHQFVENHEYESLYVYALFVTVSGQLLASYVNEKWELHAADLTTAFSPPQVSQSYQETVADFLRQRFDEQNGGETQSEAAVIIRTLAAGFAKLVARDPGALDALEWRDAERMLAEVFNGIGFTVKLTPPSKDGGKDIILTCMVSSKEYSYIVEVKHWRSGKRVGRTPIGKFLHVIVSEKRTAGLFLSTYGFANGAFDGIANIEAHRLRFGEKEKIVSLCRVYAGTGDGSVLSGELLPQLLFAETTVNPDDA